MGCAPCFDWRTLRNAWRKAMKWTDGLEHALTVMLASVSSTMAVGDQLWIKVIGPASCGKTTLCEALSVSKNFVIAKSTLRGFHSGVDDGTGEDYSLISKLGGKTLVVKDGDTLLQSPNLGQILSEARDLYDTVSRSSYRTKQGGRDYQGVRMTFILCGTSSLRKIDSSELGERFLDCVIMEGIDNDLEDEILWRVANRVERNMGVEADGSPEKQYDPELVSAMQLTGGYVEFLRENAIALLAKVEMDDDAKLFCAALGKFVAYMRARPSRMQDEEVSREFAARLVSQLIRLAKCLAVVLNKPSVDAEVLQRVKRVALDTSRGISLHIAEYLHESGSDEGMELKAVSLRINMTDDKTKSYLRFLRSLGVVELHTVAQASNRRGGSQRWRLTPRVSKLYEQVMEGYSD